MRGKIIAIFSLLIIIVVAGMVYMMSNQGIKDDKIALIFIGVFCLLIIVFVITMIITRFK